MYRALVTHLAVLGLALAGCASNASEDGTSASQDDGRDASTVATADATIAEPPLRYLTARLAPVVELTTTESGWGDVIPISDARVCANRWRRKGQTWDEFVPLEDDDRWCATSVANRQPVLNEVPEDSEVVVTVHKDGYVPAAFALETGRDQVDFVVTGWMIFVLPIFRSEGPFPDLPPGSQLVEGGLGAIRAYATTTNDGSLLPRTLGGLAGLAEARFSITPGAGGGPYYSPDGLYDRQLSETVGRVLPEGFQPFTFVDGEYSGLAEATRALLDIWTQVTFAGVPEGEYLVEVGQDRATCDAAGYQIAQPLGGFHAQADALRVPVLAGHSTTAWFYCTCDASDRAHPPEYSDPLACRLAPGDAGAD